MSWIEKVVLVGVGGKARSGKNYVAEHCLQTNGYVPLAFADAMKVQAVVDDGLSIAQAFFEEKTPETRHTLQQRGTENGWKIHGKDYWLRYAEAWAAAFASKGVRKIVVTDVRYTHEAQWIKDRGGLLVRVTGRGGLTGELSQHSSETALDDYADWDVVVRNDPVDPFTFQADVATLNAIVYQIEHVRGLHDQ
jgi:hypothetical protein